MTLQNISLSYTSLQQKFNRIHKLPCQTYKTDIGHFTAAQTHFLGLSSLHYSASHVKRLFWKFLKVQNYFLLIFDLNNYFFYFGFIHFVKYLRSCLQKKPERGMQSSQIAPIKKFKKAFLSDQPFMEQISSKYCLPSTIKQIFGEVCTSHVQLVLNIFITLATGFPTCTWW